MQAYLPYNPQSTIRVEEQIQVVDNKAFLRHIPKEGSIQIDGFTETDSPDPASGQFFCDYAKDSLYRDANRVIRFHGVDDFTQITLSYIAIGTVITADDMNEIKAHMENEAIHDYQLPTMAPNVKGGAKNGTGLVMADDTVNVDLTTAVETPYFDEEPRIFVGEGVYNYDRHAFTEWYVGLAGNGVTLEGAPEPFAFHLIDGVYYSVYGTQGAGESGEWIIPIRGKENVSVRGSGYSRVPDGQDGTVDIPYPERDLVEHEDFIITNRSSIDARTFFNVDPDAYYALDNYPDLQVLLFNNPSNATLTNVTIWADGHDAGQETKVANIIIGDNLILTGGTLNAKPMSTKDRKLLDYLHSLYDYEIP